MRSNTLEAFNPGVEKQLCRFFESKYFGVCNAILSIKTSRSTINLALEKRFFDPGAECLYSKRSYGIQCR